VPADVARPTDAASPYGTSFAHAIAWSSSAKRCTVRRAEDLALHDLVALLHIGDDGWPDEEAAGAVAVAAG
jgi:hypothetical protein